MKKDYEKVSVIVPIYNVEKYLDKCLKSICHQTLEEIEIILIDDGSTDFSGQICEQYKNRDKRIVVIHKQNEGLVQARKTGLCYATGKYICYVDGDDWIEPDMIEHLLTDIIETETDLVIPAYFCDIEDDFWKVPGRLEAGIYHVNDLISIMLYTGEFYEFGIPPFACIKLFRKEILWDIQMQVDNKISCGEDVAVTYPYILKAHYICVSDYAGYHYVQRTGSITSGCGQNEKFSNKILLKYLQKTFQFSIYADVLMVQLNQYAKNLLLVRQISYFDSFAENKRLAPYGGIPEDARVVIYGAGKLGQSIYDYLTQETSAEVVSWVDKNYERYQKMHLEVYSPEELRNLEDSTYDFLVIGINNQKTAKIVEKYLIDMSIRKEKIRWLSKSFTKEENYILDKL